MLGRLAFRNAKRSLKDYLIYLTTITISFSLILAFNLVAGADEVAELSSGMGSFQSVLSFINVVIVFVICFLINYTARFMFEKRSKELGIYMLLGIKKKAIAGLLVTEDVLLGLAAFVLAVPLGFTISQFISLMIVKLLGIPKVIFISVSLVPIGMLAIYFLAIYLLILIDLLRRIRKMTVHDFLYFEKQNEKKMFCSKKRRNVIFIVSVVLGISSLALWHSRCNMENFSQNETMTWLLVSMVVLLVSIYGITATCADMLLSILLKSKKLKYQKDHLFVARTFASKARTMSITFGTLSMLILLSLLCLNFSSINKGVYQASIESTAPYDVQIYDDKQAFEEYIRVIEEDFPIEDTVEYDVYKENKAEIQQYFDIPSYDFAPVIPLSDYNEVLKLRGMDTISLKEDEYSIITSSQTRYKLEGKDAGSNIRLSSGKELKRKGIDTKPYWYSMFNKGYFAIIVPDSQVQGLEVSENHLLVDTREETTAELEEKIRKDMEHRLVKEGEDGERHQQYYKVQVRGSAIEEQNTMTAIIASICLYIAFVLISVAGTILGVQSLSDATKYSCRYQALRRLGVNDRSLYHTIQKQLLILFGVPVIYPVIASFCMLASLNHVYHVFLESRYLYVFYFISSLAIFFLIYGIYWMAAYIGFKTNITEES